MATNKQMTWLDLVRELMKLPPANLQEPVRVEDKRGWDLDTIDSTIYLRPVVQKLPRKRGEKT